MPRTILNIDEPILRGLKRLQRKKKESLGRLVSDFHKFRFLDVRNPLAATGA